MGLDHSKAVAHFLSLRPSLAGETMPAGIWDDPGCIAPGMRGWPHAGFSIDNSVRITAEDTEGTQRLVSYVLRFPFSLARMIKVTEDGQLIYRAWNTECVRKDYAKY